MRENENRPLNPSAYTTPASVFNTLAVDIDAEKAEPASQDAPALPLKTVILPASELLKLDPIVDEQNRRQAAIVAADAAASAVAHLNFDDDCSNSSSSKASTLDRYNVPQDALLNHIGMMAVAQAQAQSQVNPPAYPIPCEIINAISPLYPPVDSNQMSLQHEIWTEIRPNSRCSMRLGSKPNRPEDGPMYVQQQPVQYTAVNAGFFQQNPLQNVQYTSNLPPHSEAAAQKSRSLERNTPANLTYAARISSLERVQNAAAKQTRSNSLTRQLSSGNETAIGNGTTMYALNSASSTSLRSGRLGTGIYSCRTNSLERNSPQIMQTGQNDGGSHRTGGSLERNQSIASTYDLMKLRAYRGGSMERNHRGAGAPEPFEIWQASRQQQQTPESEPFQEEIYDFGGANVKSCASIALNKSISKGLIPPGTKLPAMQQQPQQCTPLTSKNANLPPPTPPPTHQYQPTYIAQTSSAYMQNSIYTPMYPRIWANASPPSAGTSHIVYVQQPQPTINLVMQQQQQQQNQSQIANYAHTSQLNSSQMLNAQSIQAQNFDGIADNGLAVQVCPFGIVFPVFLLAQKMSSGRSDTQCLPICLPIAIGIRFQCFDFRFDWIFPLFWFR